MAPSLSGMVASEDGIVEQPALALLQELGWDCVNLYHDVPGPANTYGRTGLREPHLPLRLRNALERLNPTLPQEALKKAEEELTRDRTALIPVAANRELHQMLKEGVRVEIRNDQGRFEDVTVRVIDWKDPANNDFLIANQVWIEGLLHKRRPDTVGYVNGLPLLLAEWKAPTKPLATAYEDNLRDYRDVVPQLFHSNGFVILSNGIETVMGGSHAPFRHFSPLEEAGGGGARRPQPRDHAARDVRAQPLPRPDRELRPVR